MWLKLNIQYKLLSLSWEKKQCLSIYEIVDARHETNQNDLFMNQIDSTPEYSWLSDPFSSSLEGNINRE